MNTIGPVQRLILLCTPPVFAVLTLFHPAADPWELGDALDRWMVVHVGQLVLTVFLAYALWTLTEGLRSRGATVLRAALPVFLVAFSAFDAVAGMATGWLAWTSRDQTGEERAATLRSVESLFADNWLSGNLSVLGGATFFSWLAIAVGGAIALRAAGADRVTVAAMSGSVLFGSHAPPIGTVGLLALALAAYRWDRQLRASEDTDAETPVGAAPLATHGSHPNGASDERS